METFFAWPIIDPSCFRKEFTFRYGNTPPSGDLSEWNSVHEDLEVMVNIEPRREMPDLAGYISPDEESRIMIRWTGDEKFTGCGATQVCHFPQPSALTCIIPRGSCSTRLRVECNIFVQPVNGKSVNEWGRPPGSIIATIPIEDATIGRGSIFPISEYEGSGRHLIHWDFSANQDLDMPPMSGFMVYLDKKHPLFSTNDKSEESTWLINLMIIQGFVRWAFTKKIFEQLVEKGEESQPWKRDSLGASFHNILRKLRSELHLHSFTSLREHYLDHPEEIDQCVDNIYTKGLIIKPETV